MRTLLRVSLLFVVLAALCRDVRAQTAAGCCQFFAPARRGEGSMHRQRRCSDLPKDQCRVLAPSGSFFDGWRCDAAQQRCVAALPAVSAGTPTPTATPTAAHPGCCQLDHLHRTTASVCGNQISQVSCANDFAEPGTFCADCVCSSHAGPGFDLSPGVCAPPVPTPTPSPTGEALGCCEVGDLPHLAHSVCGNQISRSACLGDFGGKSTFCADCVCSSHPEPGFQFARGSCVGPSTRPRAPHRPRQ